MRNIVLLFVLCLLNHPARGQSLSLSQVTGKLQSAQAQIEDISAVARLDFALRVGILPYHDSLNGSYLYKKPDRHKLDFPNAPSYLRSVPSMFSWRLPDPEKYDCQIQGPLREHASSTYRLLYSSKNPHSKTSSITVTIDAARWRISRQETLYKDGGSVQLSFDYRDWKESFLLEKVSGSLHLPAYSLKGTAGIALSAHKVNRGLADSAF